MEPTPPAAPETATVSPGRRATASTVAHAVKPATGSPPATSHGTPAGRGVRSDASATAYSAWLDRVSTQPITSSPTATPVTPTPTRSTTPARSLPWPEGKAAGINPGEAKIRDGLLHERWPAALTLTSTCP